MCIRDSPSPVNTKKLKQWKYDSLSYRACALWCMTSSYLKTFVSVHTKTRRWHFWKKKSTLGTVFENLHVWCPKTPFTCGRKAKTEGKNSSFSKKSRHMWTGPCFHIIDISAFPFSCRIVRCALSWTLNLVRCWLNAVLSFFIRTFSLKFAKILSPW